MAGIWEYRLVGNDKGKLSFAVVRFRPFEDTISGICNPFEPPFNNGTIEDMRKLARCFKDACERVVIGPNGVDPEKRDEEAEEDL
jgi:hypothetical protein